MSLCAERHEGRFLCLDDLYNNSEQVRSNLNIHQQINVYVNSALIKMRWDTLQ